MQLTHDSPCIESYVKLLLVFVEYCSLSQKDHVDKDFSRGQMVKCCIISVYHRFPLKHCNSILLLCIFIQPICLEINYSRKHARYGLWPLIIIHDKLKPSKWFQILLFYVSEKKNQNLHWSGVLFCSWLSFIFSTMKFRKLPKLPT